jgi:YidC/Oxa1 family membrane protein insertase
VRGEGTANTVFPLDLSLQITPGVFQEPGGASVAPARSGLNGVEREFRAVMAQEAHEDSGGKSLALTGAQRYAGDLSNYFGMVLLLESFPDSVVARVQEVVAADRGDAGDSSAARTATSVEFGMRAEAGGPAVTHSGLLYMGPVDDRILAADLASKPEAAAALSLIYHDQLGWARVIGRAVLFLLDLMHGLCNNWGFAIILMTLLVRIVLFPVNRRSQDAMAKHQEQMAKLKPRLEALKKKHEGDARKFAEEQMKLMREEKVKLVPLGGCLPMLLQIPIFFGLFSALRASIDLRQAGWWWVADLSQPDHLITFDSPVANPLSLCGLIPGCGSCVGGAAALTGLHLLPILMTIAWFLNSWLMPKPATSDPQMEQQRKMMLFMPVLFGFMMYSYAAGLSLYWLVSSSIGIVEGRIIRALRARQS